MDHGAIRTWMRCLAGWGLRYLLLYTPVRYGVIISNNIAELWSYGDSNPRPLACHQQAGCPLLSITAGDRLSRCEAVCRDLIRLLYFAAALISDPSRPR